MQKDPVYILCIETASTATSVAVSLNGACLGVKEIQEANKAADKLHVFIEELLSELSLTFSQLDAVAISAGPGSYTGLRIAASAAKGYCFSLDIPLLAISTFEAMISGIRTRYGYKDADQYVPMIDARRMEVFTSFYRADGTLSRHFSSLILEEHSRELFEKDIRYFVFGNGAGKTKELLNGSNITVFEGFIPSAADCCSSAFQQYSGRHFEDIAYFEPDYKKPFYSERIS